MREKWKIYRAGDDAWRVRDYWGRCVYQFWTVYRPGFSKLGYIVKRWDEESARWTVMGRPNTWNDCLKMIAYREDQMHPHHDPTHHLEACS